MAIINSIGQGNISGNNTLIATAPGFDPSLSSNTLIIGKDSGENISEVENSAIVGIACAKTVIVTQNNALFGYNCGQLATTLTESTIIGSSAGSLGLSHVNTTLVGFSAGIDDDGSFNTAVGSLALSGSGGADGGYNTALGYNAGSAYVGTGEASNIVIMNDGVAGDVNIIRIGTDGTGNGEQNLCYIAGTVQPARNLDLLITTTTVGAITQNSVPLLHSYDGGTQTNIYCGADAGSQASVLGIRNSILGAGAFNSSTGNENTVAGFNAGNTLSSNNNVALGAFALSGGSSGNNIAIGYLAGGNYSTASESSNIVIGSLGSLSESNTIRLGSSGSGTRQQNQCFIAGIDGVTTGGTGTAVLVDSSGQLGTISSSERFKEDIMNMDSASDRLMQLRPVSFRYKERRDHGIQYGLIAEEVLDVFPELVHYGRDGEIESVHYHLMPALLLNEIQKLRKEVDALKKRCCND